jgi:anti-sigma B factor antagonist
LPAPARALAARPTVRYPPPAHPFASSVASTTLRNEYRAAKVTCILSAMSAILKIRLADDVAVVDVSGRITLGEGSSALHENMRDLITKGHAKILLNLTGVSFMDSSGIGELVSGYVSVSHNHGHVKLCGLTKRVRDLLQVTRLYRVLDIYEWEEDALRSFKSS